ncbi:farnesyl pyrophosphate synthase-like [Centruroides sculpturatus]|uniref:farnesyl pyrophosphate synthase-like n=1 Tax=Centruroides sculpturatus TaxID=218467 RepID=UPI000C6CC881|nr:farnesyl pyrophosphate synthase-like [Centruroides sculpturatus]
MLASGISMMNFGRLINRTAKLCSKSRSWIKCNKKVWTFNVTDSYRTKSTAQTSNIGLINREGYFKEKDLNLLDQREVEEFDAAFTFIVEDLINEEDIQDERIKDVFIRFKEILEYNIPHGKKKHALALVSTYKFLVKSKDLIEENIKLAYILGWCVEMIHAYFLILDDITDQAFTRRGRPCWFRNENIGLIAINDAIMIESGIFYLLKKHLKNLPCYVNVVEAFHWIIRFSSFGQSMDMMSEYSRQSSKFEFFTEDKYSAITMYKTAYSCVLPVKLALYLVSKIHSRQSSKFEFFTEDKYSAITTYKTAYSCVLPVKLALYLVGWTNETHLKNIEQILVKIGQYFQVLDDYLDCYGDPVIMGKQGTDIVDGKCSWMIVTALKKASEEQIATLKENFGVHEESAVRKIKQVYDELELPKLYDQYEEETFRELTILIDNVTNSSILPPEMFYRFIKTIYEINK